MSIKHKFKRGDPVLIFDCKELVGGGVGVVLDKDALELAYEVREVQEIDKTVTRWVHEENLQLLYFKKPKNIFERIKRWLKELL